MNRLTLNNNIIIINTITNINTVNTNTINTINTIMADSPQEQSSSSASSSRPSRRKPAVKMQLPPEYSHIFSQQARRQVVRYPDAGFGIDHIIRDFTNDGVSARKTAATFVPFNGIPTAEKPPSIIDSGVEHTLLHAHCVQSLEEDGEVNNLSLIHI